MSPTSKMEIVYCHAKRYNTFKQWLSILNKDPSPLQNLHPFAVDGLMESAYVLHFLGDKKVFKEASAIFEKERKNLKNALI